MVSKSRQPSDRMDRWIQSTRVVGYEGGPKKWPVCGFFSFFIIFI
jgi:glutaredoxin-related protein